MLQNTKKIHLILHLICEKSTESLIVQNIFKYKALEPNGSEGLWGGGEHCGLDRLGKLPLGKLHILEVAT